MKLVYYFLGYSGLGWILESSYKSVLNKKLMSSGYLTSIGLPFPVVPVYGIGALILIHLQPIIKSSPVLIRSLVYILILTLFELGAGVFSQKILNKKLWDYSNNKFNVAGHIDLRHSIYWLLLALVFEKIHPFFTKWAGLN